MDPERRKDSRTREVLEEVKDEVRDHSKKVETEWQKAIAQIQDNYEALRRQLLYGLRWLVVLSFLLPALVVLSFLAYSAEQRERRDQACAISEAKQRKDIDTLRRTYAFLLDPPPDQRGLARLVRPDLARVEAEARLDDAPPYCDEDGIGESEPDPTVPRRPEALR